jgi:Na+-translocating ferredoxin:NAD+ oxidoreductase RnfG subunit
METKYKISIPEPCTENWDKMTPKDNGRFCLSCTKTVVDFTTMLPEEVQHYFISNQNKSICGRFKNTQLDEIIIQIPNRVLYSQTQYHKMFLLALFIAMGTTLFSCSDKNGNKQKIDTIEIVDNASSGKSIIRNDSASETDSKKSNEKCTPQATMGIVIPKNDEIPLKYDIVFNSNDLDVLPVPEEGMKKFYAFFTKNYTAPGTTKKYRGKIFILFVIEKDGSLNNFNIVKNTPVEIGEEAIKILKTAPNWIPGKINNTIVRSSYILPITIK